MTPSGVSSSTAELYVYYTVAPESLARAAAALEQLVRACGAAGLAMRCLRRRDEKDDGSQTWMEVYLATPGLLETLEPLLSSSGLPALCGTRVLEWFVALP